MINAEQHYTNIGANLADAVQSQMFGKPCLKINGKAFASFYLDKMVFKLGGLSHQEAMNLEGAQLFDPSGKNRPMKEWVQVPYVHHEKWEYFAALALTYVKGLK